MATVEPEIEKLKKELLAVFDTFAVEQASLCMDDMLA